VSENASQEEIKKAFKKQAVKWHPDRNPGLNTTSQMQAINEAYLILKDSEARALYDKEYRRYTEHKKNKFYHTKQNVKKDTNGSKKTEENNFGKFAEEEEVEFQVLDDLLKKWMNNARRQAVELAKQTLEDLVGMIAVGTKAGVKEAGSYLIIQVAITICVIFLLLLYKSCN
jgi:curved DNA-binding protein CbpA